MPLLSVIVTAYNIEAYLAECLDSVLGQTLEDIEVIVVDDGSSDATPGIIRDYAARDARIRPIYFAENTIGGVASAANAGLDAATGDYIGFVDGDDYLEATMFEELVGAARAHGTDLAMCRYMEAVGEDRVLREPAERMRWVGFSETRPVMFDSDAARVSILRFIAVPWRKVYARRLIEDNGIRFPVVDHFWEDNPFHWFTVCAANGVTVVPRVLCYHRVGRAGQTMATRDRGLIAMFGHYGIIRDWLEARGMLARFHAPLLGWAISQFQWIHRRIPKEAGGELYDVMAAIVGPVDQAVFDAALQEKRFAVRRQMRRVRCGDREAFLKHFERQFGGPAKAGAALRRRVERPLAVLRLGVGHLRANGLGHTLKRVGQHLPGGGPGGLAGRRDRAVSEEQMLRLLTLLERDLERRHRAEMARLEALEAEVKALRARLDGGQVAGGGGPN